MQEQGLTGLIDEKLIAQVRLLRCIDVERFVKHVSRPEGPQLGVTIHVGTYLRDVESMLNNQIDAI